MTCGNSSLNLDFDVFLSTAICECLKYEDKMERAVFQEGVLSYIKDEKKDIANLMKYARERRVVKKVQSMIGVWL